MLAVLQGTVLVRELQGSHGVDHGKLAFSRISIWHA